MRVQNHKVIAYLLFISFFAITLGCQKQKTPLEQLIEESSNKFSIHIQGGQVINGKNEDGIQADILIREDKIVYIGEMGDVEVKATKTINAKGKIISPGFIDTHAHGDPLRAPEFHNFLAMGVTSIVLGQDGFSPPYDDLGEWMDDVDSIQPSVNIIPFIGHSTIRELTEVNYTENPSQAQISSMASVLENALNSGAWGMSTGLEYLPGSFARDQELLALAKIVGKYDGLIMSHMRSEDEDEIENSIDELLRQGQFCDVHIAHFKVVYGKGADRAYTLLKKLKEAKQKGHKITADLYPYTASYTGIGIVFPDWAKAPNNYQEVKRNRRTELAQYLRKRVNQRNGPSATLLGTQPYAGKTLEQLAVETDKPFEEILIDEIGPTGASGAYFVMNETLQETLLKDSAVMVCSDGSPTMRHPRGYGTFARIIETFVNNRKALALEQAIFKMTGLSAQTLKLKDRGTLEIGKKADILIFDPLEVRETATFEQPHQLAQGFNWVIVNGNIAVENGDFSSKRHGEVLRSEKRDERKETLESTLCASSRF